MTAMQVLGSLVAIPVGLGSAYSIYRANFSVDTTCQTLRAGIISMIDKKIDATARRMLVRHDVETFEKVCGEVDPDAAAAFKTLLAEPTVRHIETPAKAAAAKRVDAPKADVKAEPSKEMPKVELRAAMPAESVAPAKERAKQAAKEPAKEQPNAAEAAAQPHDAAADARWLDAVRGALVAHEKTAEPAESPVARGAPPRALAVMPAAPASTAPAPAAAPALPPPTQVSDPAGANAAAAQPADPDRLIPPASIPEQTGPKPTGWLSHVPFVGQVLTK